ncbi:MAG TPA: TetR/AcrR family transcriptional regulator [Propionicimonas sp.]|uniref:TetR/AcrR family transcriptional regulator n=1 Tax=Propionicimonas sp. TaxID=1955623 RepID=UPI002F3F36FE
MTTGRRGQGWVRRSATIEAEDPRVTRSRALILDAAATVFLSVGYTAATVEGIAVTAGVAKRTIYNLYADKAALFRATILRSIDTADDFTSSLVDAVRSVVDPVAELPQIGARLAEAVLTRSVLPLRRLLVMESRTFPELAAEYRDRAPEAVLRALADLFASLSRTGHLSVSDPQVAAEHFAFLVMGADLDRGMFVAQQVEAGRMVARSAAGVAAFLRAYAPPDRSRRIGWTAR